MPLCGNDTCKTAAVPAAGMEKILSGKKRLSDQVQCNDLAGGETACLSGTVSEQHGTVDLDVNDQVRKELENFGWNLEVV